MKVLNKTDVNYVLEFNGSELDLIIAGLRETLEALEDWEFETRVGAPRSEMRRLLEEEVFGIASPWPPSQRETLRRSRPARRAHPS